MIWSSSQGYNEVLHSEKKEWTGKKLKRKGKKRDMGMAEEGDIGG